MTIRAAHHHPILGNQNLLSYFPNIEHLDTFTCLYSEILCSKSVYILKKKKKNYHKFPKELPDQKDKYF